MTREEHLLTILSEECAEIIQNVSKALRFGLNNHHPETDISNKKAIEHEFAQLIGVYYMLIHDGALDDYPREVITEKQENVERWLK